MNKKTKVNLLKYGRYTSSDFYRPSFLDMKDPYFVQLREQFFEDIWRHKKRWGVKTKFLLPYSEDIVVNDDSLEETLTRLQ